MWSFILDVGEGLWWCLMPVRRAIMSVGHRWHLFHTRRLWWYP